ncbi:MAG: HAD family hydrolase [Pirellulaceae bacterium]|nr:HAD family hydrolase [Pirellulaceae bacterium]
MRTLLFDIDGTLLLTNQGGAGAFEQALTEEFSLPEPSINVSFAGRTDRSLLAQLLTINDLPETAENVRRLQQRYVSVFPNVLRQRGGTVLPGVRDLLAKLHDEPRVRICVMTGNLQQTGEHKLAHFDLLPYVQWISGGEFDSHRDDLARRTATIIQDRHGTQSLHNVIVIGDTTADVRCGHAIGARVLAVCTGGDNHADLQTESPMAILPDLSNVDQVCDLLLT